VLVVELSEVPAASCSSPPLAARPAVRLAAVKVPDRMVLPVKMAAAT
jgi:hypothetical protein